MNKLEEKVEDLTDLISDILRTLNHSLDIFASDKPNGKKYLQGRIDEHRKALKKIRKINTDD